MKQTERPNQILSRDDLEIGALETFVGYHLRRANHVIADDFARAVTGTGMRQVLYGLMSIIQINPGVNQAKVGKTLGIQRANMVALITELIDKGWIARYVDAEDKRAFILYLTTAGEAVFADVTLRLHAHEETVLSNLNKTERKQLIDLLRRIQDQYC